MIKVTVTNTTQASELIEAFSDKDYDVEIVVKENTVGQDDVKDLIRLNCDLMQETLKILMNFYTNIVTSS